MCKAGTVLVDGERYNVAGSSQYKVTTLQTTSHGPRSFVQEQKGNACRREKDSSRLSRN